MKSAANVFIQNTTYSKGIYRPKISLASTTHSELLRYTSKYAKKNKYITAIANSLKSYNVSSISDEEEF